MRTTLLLTICIFIWIPKSNSQRIVEFIDSVENTFEQIDLPITVVGNLKFERKVNDFGRAYYIDSLGTRLEFSFFNVLSLPFYNEFQTEFGTSTSYVNWLKYLNPNINEMEFSMIQESMYFNYVVIRLSDGIKKSSRIISRLKNVFYCISITSTEISIDGQIKYLALLLKYNKKIHNE